MSNYCGVILAAGVGSRIRPLSVDYPKPLLPVLNKPIIEHQIESLRDARIRECFVVCGHLQDRLEEALGTGSSIGVDIRYVRQDKPLGIAHALSKVEPFVDKPFVLFLGDIFFTGVDLPRMIQLFENRGASAVLAAREEPHEEYLRRNYAVMLHESGMVRRVVEKPRHARTNLKGIGVYLFDLPIFDAVRRTPRTAMRDEYELTSSIQILLEDGYPVFHAPMTGWDMNITTIEDLWRCNRQLMQSHGCENVIGRDVDVHPGATVRDSVIGDGVSIRHPIRLSRAVVLSGSHVTCQQDVADAVVHNGEIYQASWLG
jgi:NDP-sugar pyrophosphorylase family protein